MGDRDEFAIDVLKNALKTQRQEAEQRENALKAQLDSFWKRATREREMLLKEIALLKGEGKSASPRSPRTRISLLGNASDQVASPSAQQAGSDVWALDADEKRSAAAGDKEGAAAGGPWDVSDWELSEGSKYRIMSLDAKVKAQLLTIRDLHAQIAQQETSLTKQQQRNGMITARMEEKDAQIAALELKISRLTRRLNSLDAFAPPEWGAPSLAKHGSGLSAVGMGERDTTMLQGASGHNNWHQEDGMGGEELVPGYAEFESRLHDPSAAPLLGMIQSFVSAFLLKSPKISDHSMVHNFLGAMENPLRAHTLWKDVGEEDMVLVIDALETFILSDTRVYECIFSSMGEDWRQMDRHLNRRMWCLQFVQPQHLDIKRAHYSHPAMTMARKAMKRMTTVRAPQEKMECIFRSARIIFRMLNESAAASRTEAASADDFLPIFIYTVLKAQTWRLHSTLEYISLFRNPKQFGGERQYYLVQLQTALAFISHMDGKSLSMEEEEFDRRLKEREGLWEVKYG
eukprot:CAMPEP_0181298006 /NCGR_PEP_ID=MMETSP1101-20121128/5553_1 /TAXON_ID=46948 /ORGANISM="Rhodomonas abbreviata, Strain Caron Lab Isolate" /LENGTH=515 /DNA_ID=CAMNT_0023403001 /DNA_START=258 /DNA_END=1801 /DNA_ORIENTATION=+